MINSYIKFAVLLAVAGFGTAKGPKVLWMDQRLDHFNSSDSRMWQMRYMEDDKFFQPGGPLFIHVGGKEPLSPSNIGNGSQIHHMAREHHGYLFHTEHRSYGRSRALDEDLKYLDSRQALADLARFVLTKSDIHGMEFAKVILVGCGSGGALATWFKQLYPDFVSGVWASSATLLAKTDLSESKMLAGETIKKVGGDACYNRIKEGIAEMQDMFENKRGDEVKIMFRLCDSFNETNHLDVATLIFEISETFFKFVTDYKVGEIQQECNKLMYGISDLVALGYYIANKLGVDECNELSYSTKLNYFKNPLLSSHILRQWTYQNCNEFGWFKPSDSLCQIFGTRLPLDYFFTRCADIYGYKFTKEYIEAKVEETNVRFGGLNPDVENVYWTNGELDPYRVLSIQNGIHATVIPNLYQCGDLHEVTPEDSPELKASKEKLEMLVREWLA